MINALPWTDHPWATISPPLITNQQDRTNDRVTCKMPSFHRFSYMTFDKTIISLILLTTYIWPLPTFSLVLMTYRWSNVSRGVCTGTIDHRERISNHIECSQTPATIVSSHQVARKHILPPPLLNLLTHINRINAIIMSTFSPLISSFFSSLIFCWPILRSHLFKMLHRFMDGKANGALREQLAEGEET